MSVLRRLSSILMVFMCLISVAGAEDRYSYTVKGVVRALPGNGRANNELIVKHEPIPEYRDESGKIVGMMAMTMPFYLADGVSWGELKVGDPVEMIVEQTIRPSFSDRVVRITKLK